MPDKTPLETAEKGAPVKQPSRILVGIDGTFDGREIVQIAARFAGPLRARLVGLFVEDENLYSLAGLPFAREVSWAGVIRTLTSENVTRELQARAAAARRYVRRLAEEVDIDWAFETARGHPLATLAQAAGPEDIVVVCTQSRGTAWDRDEVGRVVRVATREVHADVLLVAQRAPAALSRRQTAAVAARALTGPDRPLVAVDETGEAGGSCTRFAEELARRAGTPYRRLDARGMTPGAVAQAARRLRAGLIVIDASCSIIGHDQDAALIADEAGSPILILGSARPEP